MSPYCEGCGQPLDGGMAFCANCGTPTGSGEQQGFQTNRAPPIYSVQPQYVQAPYPPPAFYPYPSPYYNPPNPKRTAAGGGCTIMILDGALAIPIWLILLAGGEPVPGLVLMVASLVAIIGGSLALKGILPLVAAAGPPMLILASVILTTVDPFLVVVAIIGSILAIISLLLVIYGWTDLLERARMRERALQGMHRY